MENRDIVHEQIIRLDGEEEAIFRNRIQGLGWGFMYEDLVRINVSMVREFCANFSSTKQDHVFLRGKRIPFTEADVRRYLNIPRKTPDDDQDDNFEALIRAYGRGDDMNMAEIYSVIGREETNWANDPANNTIPKSINNGILNPRATAWHKIINANIDPKTHGTNFDMKHALLIYVLMAGGEPRIMSYPSFPMTSSTLSGPWILMFPMVIGGEREPGHQQRRQPPPREEPAEQLPQPETSAALFAPTQPATDHPYQQIMRHLERQERLLRRQGRQIANTRIMIRQAFPDTVFEGLVSDDSSESQEF
ncbi:hypothetical protein PIB30_096487 [Stylosanthes scabra]|uniref:Putative plant transposon protein domain-containing protein n=1 Tax=Stylosanthes scabra TaxID=79078 RepID=A0ABU6SXL2_9FABA|nr:hypothetical protein [Stylosanthes scabra]